MKKETWVFYFKEGGWHKVCASSEADALALANERWVENNLTPDPESFFKKDENLEHYQYLVNLWR
jgi:hypothetical protein